MMTKVAAAFIVSVLLTCRRLVSCTDPVCDLYALKGADFKVPLVLKLGDTRRLTWTHNNENIFRQKGDTYIKGKQGDVTEDGSLWLKKVQKEQEGTYTAEVHNAEGKSVGPFKPVRLCVQDSVKQPKVTMRCKSPTVTFTCSEKGEGGKVVWSQQGKVMKETGASVTLEAEKVEKLMFNCTVSNKVSKKTSDGVIQTCFKSGITLPEEILGINTWVFIGAGGGIALLLLIIVIVCCIRARRRKRLHIKDEEELRLGWTNPNQQQQQQQQQQPHHHHHHPNQRHHHHHHHEQHQHQHQHRQQPAGHTGPRPHRPKQQRHKQQPDQYSSQPQPSPRRAAQAPQPADEEKPPPLPQPRKKAPKTPHV